MSIKNLFNQVPPIPPKPLVKNSIANTFKNTIVDTTVTQQSDSIKNMYTKNSNIVQNPSGVQFLFYNKNDISIPKKPNVLYPNSFKNNN